MSSLGRRGFLATLSLSLSTLAGCGEDGERTTATGPTEGGSRPATDSTATDGTGTTVQPTTTEAASATDTASLDLREANAVQVTVAAEGEGRYRFDVTLHHDDDGEAGYENWWQVEGVDGEQLGRRALAHAHSTQPFTRSATIRVPAGITCVVVRGHDQTHGYGGRAMLVNLDSGATEAADQGPEPRSFADATCPGDA